MERYDDWEPELMRMIGLSKHLRVSNVRHQETCPGCGRTLVNIYRRGSGRVAVWRCKKCWDKIDKDPDIQRVVDGMSGVVRDEALYETLKLERSK